MKRYTTFKEFFPFYLSQHQNFTCRLLHFVGTGLGLGILTRGIMIGEYTYILYALLCGYLFAWIGHFVFEKNRPATFTYPFYSLLGDFVLFFGILTFRIKLKE